ncbi:DNA-binding response regulator LuxR family [Micromonospora sp. B006]|nr:DNA-binding response regulator LuxR family [Micromonospora sp. B006]
MPLDIDGELHLRARSPLSPASRNYETAHSRSAEPVEPLTAREEQVLLAAARGRTNSEIGDELSISLSTVKTHIAALMRKLNARNRVEIVMWAYETHRVGT